MIVSSESSDFSPPNGQMNLKRCDPESLKPHPDNYNQHPPEQIEHLKASLADFDQVKNIVVWNGLILAGHGLVEAAILAGRPAVEYLDVSDWPEEKARAFLFVDNETARMAQPDYARLQALVEEAKAHGQPTHGVTPERLAEIAAEARAANGNGAGGDAEPQIDKAAELQEIWQVKLGDLWACGEHRIICGDCREPETWERLLDGRKVNGVFTSPPYAEQRKAQYGGVPTTQYVEWWEAVQANVRANLAEDGSFFVNIKPHCEDGQRVLYVFDLVLAMVRRWGWRFVDELCWYRSSVPGDYKPRLKNAFEPIYHFSGKKCKHKFDNILMAPSEATIKRQKLAIKSREINKGRGYSNTGSGFNIDWARNIELTKNGVLPSNVLNIASDHSAHNHLHSATFPVSLPTFFIKAYSDPGDLWIDPFIGSGTTIIAAHDEGRTGYGIERLEKYCAVILERVQQYTGIQPHRLEAA